MKINKDIVTEKCLFYQKGMKIYELMNEPFFEDDPLDEEKKIELDSFNSYELPSGYKLIMKASFAEKEPILEHLGLFNDDVKNSQKIDDLVEQLDNTYDYLRKVENIIDNCLSRKTLRRAMTLYKRMFFEVEDLLEEIIDFKSNEHDKCFEEELDEFEKEIE